MTRSHGKGQTNSKPATPQGSVGLTDDQVRKLCTRLEFIFVELDQVHDVIVVCQRLCAQQNVDDEASVAKVLTRCAIDPLYLQLKELTRVVGSLGGETSYSKDMENDNDEKR